MRRNDLINSSFTKSGHEPSNVTKAGTLHSNEHVVDEHTPMFYPFPQAMHRYIRTTNAIESLYSNVRQRTDQIDSFTTEMSCLTIV